MGRAICMAIGELSSGLTHLGRFVSTYSSLPLSMELVQ